MGVTEVLGISLMAIAIMISLRTSKCASKKMQASLQACLVAATTFIVVPISYLFYRLNCSGDEDETSLTLFAVVFLIYGIGLITVGSFLLAANKEEKSNPDCKDISIEAGIVMGIGLLMTVFSIGNLGYEMFETNKAAQKKTAVEA